MNVEVEKMTENQDGFSVRAVVDGEQGELNIRHTFPKNSGYLEESEDGVPKFVESLKSLYNDKVKKVKNEGVEGKKPSDYEKDYSF